MRPQDEILLALPRQPPPGRRFLLRRLAELPIAEDVRIVHHQVRGLDQTDHLVAALLAEDAVWRRRELERLRRSVGEESGQGGTWTAMSMPAIGKPNPENVQDASIAAGQALEALLDPLRELALRGEEEARWVARALGHIQSHKALGLLEDIAMEQGHIAPVVVAYASLGGEAAADRARLMTKAVEGTAVYPQLFEVFARIPTRETFQFLVDEARKGQPAVCAGVACALEGFRAFNPLPVIDALFRVPDPWVLINCVETLGRIGLPECLQRIARVFDTQQHPLIRIGCLQAISGSSGPMVEALAQKGLATNDPNVQAAAIEAMAAAGIPHQTYAGAVLTLLNSPHPKLSLNASLACVQIDPGRAGQRVSQMLGSGQPAQLLVAVQCLAYIESPSSVQALKQIIGACPPGPMRNQAVKSLGRLATRMPEAVPRLLEVLEMDDPGARELATWFLANAHPTARAQAGKGLTAALSEALETPLGVTIIEALGLLGPAGQLAVPDLHHALLIGPDQANAAARALATAFPRSREAADLRTHESAMVQGYGGLLEWLENGSGTYEIAQALTAPDPFINRIACGVVRTAGAAGAWTTETRRLMGLAKALGAAELDAKEAHGLGKLDQSVVIPRKKIGVGIVPKASPGRPAQVQVQFDASTPGFQQAGAGGDEEILSQSYYETTRQEAIRLLQTEPPPEPAAPAPMPASEPVREPPGPTVSASRPQPSGTRNPPAPRPPSEVQTESKAAAAVRGIGLVILCVAAIFLGRYLKTLLR